MEINHSSKNENETTTAQIISKKWEDDCNSVLKLDIGNPKDALKKKSQTWN